MDLEYYTIEQAADWLECRPDEIEHHIETGRVRSHLYCYSKKFIILNPHPNYTTARAIACYTGLIKPHHSFIQLAFHRKDITLNKRLTLKALSGISSWNGKQHFKSNLYQSETGISKWIPENQNCLNGETEIPAIPLPYEGPGLMRVLHGLLDTINKTDTKEKDFDPNDPPEFSYSFSTNGTFKKSDIRITHEDLTAFQQLTQPTKTQETPLIKNTVELEKPKVTINEGKRINELHQVLKSIVADHINANANELWRVLQHEAESSPRKYDTEEVIDNVTSEAIHWTSSYDNETTLSRSSFPSTISQLKKKLLLTQ